jgi:hypothetical protein
VVVSVKDYGAVGDGFTDDVEAIQAAFDSGASEVVIPRGNYAVSQTLYLGSDITVRADRCARIVMKSGRGRKRGDFLISNRDSVNGNKNIRIEGGIWDGNNTSPDMAKPDIFDKGGYSGAVINFTGVRGLTLTDLVVANSTTYYTRLSRVEDFLIENIDLVSDFFGHNQDGLHFGGGVRRGTVRNLRALSIGQTNDDMIAFNADDSVERIENLDLVRDAIEDITVENVFAVNCYTVIRMLSVDAPIRNIRISGVYAGYRNYVVNGDGARYCKTPLFREEDRPDGVGRIENVLIEDLTCYPVLRKPDNMVAGQVDPTYAVRLECLADNFVINGFNKLGVAGDAGTYALLATNVVGMRVEADGEEYILSGKSDRAELRRFESLRVDRVK